MTQIQSAIFSYESEKMAQKYLIFHYGTAEEQMPYPFGPKNAVNFPQRCVTECVNFETLPPNFRALEIGCALGRTSFELSRYCAHVLAIDSSHHFISLAKRIQQGEEVEYFVGAEGGLQVERKATRPEGVNEERIEFRCASGMDLIVDTPFEIVLGANLLCRLPDPVQFLRSLSAWVAPMGQLILISPYSWLEEYTPREKWLCYEGKSCLDSMHQILDKHFILQKYFDMPFVMREHQRKFEWGVSQATIWQRQP